MIHMINNQRLFFRIHLKDQLIALIDNNNRLDEINFCINANALVDANKRVIIYELENMYKNRLQSDIEPKSPYIVDPIIPRVWMANRDSSRGLKILKRRFKIDEIQEEINHSEKLEELINELTKKVVKFQDLTRNQPSLKEFSCFEPIQLRPQFYILPYFEFMDTNDISYQITKYVLDCARLLFPKIRLATVICSTISNLEKYLDDINEDFRNANGLILWYKNYDGERKSKKINDRKIEIENQLAKSYKILTAYGWTNDFSNKNVSGIILKTNARPQGYIKSGKFFRRGAKKEVLLHRSEKMGTINQFSNSIKMNPCLCSTCVNVKNKIERLHPTFSKNKISNLIISEFKKNEKIKIQHFRDGILEKKR